MAAEIDIAAQCFGSGLIGLNLFRCAVRKCRCFRYQIDLDGIRSGRRIIAVSIFCDRMILLKADQSI